MAGKEQEIHLFKAIAITCGFLLVLLLLWTFLGFHFFWQQMETTARLDKEQSRFEDRLVSEPADPEALFQLGWIYYQKRNLDRAEEIYQEVIAMRPKHAAAHYNLGLVYLDKGKYELAEKEFRLLVTRYPKNTEALVGLGRSLLSLNKPGEAEIYLRRSLAREPYSADAHYYLGLCLEKKSSLEEARKEFQEALRYVPDYQQALQGLKRVKAALGRED